ncbi:MAG: T9SS type A sorting domain-containing protein [Roseivirga sp.]|nr:T9SS type A sorting domain-containing protein [Roseivirga sp.]
MSLKSNIRVFSLLIIIGLVLISDLKATGKKNSADPTVTSIVRQSPADATTDADEVTFRVTFSDDVRRVTSDDFALSGTAAADGTVASVTAVSSSVYDVTITGIDNSRGTINLDIKGIDATGSNDIAKMPVQLDANSTADIQITDSPVFGQSFRPVNSGLLVDVILKNGVGHNYSGPGTLELISGEGYGGTVLATENIQVTKPLGEKTYTFSNPPLVSSGSTYTLRVNIPGAPSLSTAFSAQVGAGYSGGYLYQASIFSSADLYFKLYIASGAIESLGTSLPSPDETFIISNPPSANNVAISGNLSVGEQLTGTYDFADPVGGSESGSTFKWYRADDVGGNNKTEISGAIAKIYTITQDDIGSFLSFEVTPSNGTDTGVAAESTALQVATPVVINSVTRLTPSASDIQSSVNPVFRVTFNKGVRNVNADDFVVNSTAGGAINTVTPVDERTYDVTINNLNHAGGTLGLKVKGIDGATGTNNITDIAYSNGAVAHQQTTENDYLNQDLIGQSFTASSNNYLTAFTLFPRSGTHSFSGTARLRVFQGDASGSAVLGNVNAVLFEGTIDVSGSTSVSGQTFTIAEPPQLSSGTIYSIVLDNFTGSGTRAFNAHTSGSLANGRAFFTSSNNSSHAAFDFMIDIFEGSQTDGDALFDSAPGTNETYTVLGNAAPTATNVTFTGTISVGEELTGTYTWADTDAGDTESGSTFKWYRSDDNAGSNKTAIPGATLQTYTLTNDDKAKFISFEVTPNDGTTAGTPVESALQGAVPSVSVASIVRQTPTDATTDADQVTFRVTFDAGVTNVDKTDFNLSGTAASDGTISTVTAASSTVYDVLVTGIASSNGTLGLEIANGNDIKGPVSALEQLSTTSYRTDSYVNQTFVAPESGTMTHLKFWTVSGPYNLTLTIKKSGTTIHSQGVTTSDGTGTLEQNIALSTPVDVIKGDAYEFRLSVNSGHANFRMDTSDPYAGGLMTSGFGNGTHWDLTFSLLIASPETAGLAGIIPTTDESYTLINNVAPTATPPTSPTVTEDDINVAIDDDIQISDADVADIQTVTFSITGGTLNIGEVDVTFGGEGNGTASFTAAGSLSSINTALDAATFTPTANLNGAGAGIISFVSNDGQADSNEASVTFDISSENDKPVFSSPSVTTVNDNTTYTYNITTSDADGDDVTVTATTVPGWLSLNQSQRGVSTLTGTGLNRSGGTGPGTGVAQDGSLNEASFSWPSDIIVDDQQNIYILDRFEGKLRKISNDGNVTTIAGSQFGTQLGTGTNAQLKYPEVMALGNNNLMYVPSGFGRDSEDFIRKIDVTTGAVTAFVGGLKGVTGLAYDKATDILYASHSGFNGESEILMFDTQGNKTVLAGNGTGSANGTGTDARFYYPRDLLLDGNGNLYVSDQGNNSIRKIELATKVVSTVAGGTRGTNDGTGTDAQFSGPFGLAMDAESNLYVADRFNYAIRKIDPNGVVTTVSGIKGESADLDGSLETAKFYDPDGLTIDGQGNILVADQYTSKIRKISFTKSLTLAGDASGQTAGDYPVTLTANDGNSGTATQVFNVTVVDVTDPVLTSATTASDFAENGTGTVYIVTGTDTNALTYSLGSGNDEALFNIDGSTGVVTFKTAPDFENPFDQGADNAYVINVIASDPAGNTANQNVTFSVINVSDEDPVFTSTPVTTVNDNATYTYDITTSDVDGDDITVTATTKPAWLSLSQSQKGVSTFAGTGLNRSGGTGPGTGVAQDGSLSQASFSWPTDIILDDQQNMYILDRFEGKLRKITSDGNVTTIAGSEFGTQLGTGTNAQLKYPEVMALGNNNIMYVPSGFSRDPEDFIRKIDVTTGAVTAFAGGLKGVSGLAYDRATDMLYASHSGFNGENEILMFDTQGNKTVLAGNGSGFINGTGTDAKFFYPRDLLLDGNGNLYVSDQGNNSIRKIELATKVVSTVAGGSRGTNDGTGTDAQFNGPFGLAMDAQNNLYVADRFNYAIRKIDQNGVVTTVAGIKGESADLDGGLETAKFFDPDGLAIDAQGNLLVADQYTSKIRKISFTTSLTLAGDATGQTAGDYPVTLTAADGNGGMATQTFNVTVVDVTAPAKPVIIGISDDTGSSATDGVTSDRNLLIHGTAEANATVEVFSPGGLIGTVQADVNGNWTLDITQFTLPEITSNTTVEAIDQEGNRSVPSDGFVIDIDFTAPAKPVITGVSDDTGSSNSDGITSDRNLLIHGKAEANATVEIFSPGGLIGTVQADGHGDWTLDITQFTLPEMTSNTTAEAIDLAGNRSATSDVFMMAIDFTAPAKPVITGISDDKGSSNTDGITSDRNLLIHGTAEANATVEVFSPGGSIGIVQADVNGNWTLDISQFTLPEMTSNTTAEAIDLAGNRSATSDVFVIAIDFTAPAKPVITSISDDTGSSNTDGVTSDRNLLIHGTAEANAAVEVFSPGGKIGETQTDANGNWTLDITRFNLPQMTANMTAEAIDLAGNRSTASDIFTLKIDYTAPVKPVITGISDDTGISTTDGVTSDRNLLIHGTAEAGADVEVFSTGGVIGMVQADANGDWILDITRFNLPEMTANMTAEAIDLAGNRSAASDIFTVKIDFTAPGVSIAIANNSVAGYLITAVFDEEVSGLTLADISVAGGTASDLVETNQTTYSFLVNTSTGSVDVSINADAAQDVAGNGNTPSNQLTLGLPSNSSREGFTNLENVTQTEEISVYPNPASKVLTFDLSELSAEAVDIYMYDAAGVPVFMCEAYKEETLSMDVSEYTSGLYIVQFYDGVQVVRKKVLVKK